MMVLTEMGSRPLAVLLPVLPPELDVADAGTGLDRLPKANRVHAKAVAPLMYYEG